MAETEKSRIRVTLVRSPLGRIPAQRATVKALGLGKLNSTVDKPVNDAILGMIRSISHLVRTEELKS